MRLFPRLNYGVLFDFSKKRNRQSATVAELANLARRKLISELGEAGFARACLTFDRQLAATCSDLTYANAPLLLHYARAESGATKAVAAKLIDSAGGLQKLELEQQLALVWLTGHGWGHLNLGHLLQEK